LAAFQSGEAGTAIRDTQAQQGQEMLLSEDQLTAVADMVMLPQRSLTRTELVTVIGQQVVSGAANERAVAAAIGSPVGFGGQTGSIRGVMAGAQTMNLSPEDLARIADLIRDGLRDVAQQELISRGGQPQAVRELVSDMTALPAAMIVPQTARPERRPGAQIETAVNPQVNDAKKETE
ncbi:MAG: hypothetical protein GY942_20755, partial [Aestuariibacter sp.]|nr:hypothetical protein [Aestuariibacter sp.]